MDCQICGRQLPSEAKACPYCGTLTPAYYSNSGASPHDPTTPAGSASSPSAMSAPPPPPTRYGANPYEGSWQSPYPVNPYEAAPPPPPQHQANRIGIIVGVILLVLLLIGGGVFAWLQYSAARTTVATLARATATPQHFTAQGTFTIVSKTNISVRQDGQNKIYSYTQQGVDSGDITGSFMEEETSIVHPDNTANFSGTSTCTCTVAGKSGTFTYSYTGTSTANGSFQGQTFDSHRSGTGDLTKLHGQGVFQGQGTHGTYSSELYFDA
jgi:hypothetical protein